MFERATVPDVDDLLGEYAVHLVTPFLPPLRFFGHKKQVPPRVSENGGGKNALVGGMIRLGDFHVERGPSSLGDGLEVLKIIYDAPKSPKLLQWLTDEVREYRKGYYICRGVYNLFGRPTLIMYFTLTKL